MVSRKFLRFAAICLLGSFVTTLGVHWLPVLWAEANTFEKQLLLPNNSIYMAQRWMVLVHCALVVISMFGLGALKFRQAPALAILGFISFFVFAFCEMLRTSISLFALNRRWRPGYLAATDESGRAAIKATIDAFAGINDALFFLFYVAFSLGLLCYGLMLVKDGGLDGAIGWLFLLWAAVGVPGTIDTIAGRQMFAPYFVWVGQFFVPSARLLVGLWLWQKSKNYKQEIAA